MKLKLLFLLSLINTSWAMDSVKACLIEYEEIIYNPSDCKRISSYDLESIYGIEQAIALRKLAQDELDFDNKKENSKKKLLSKLSQNESNSSDCKKIVDDKDTEQKEVKNRWRKCLQCFKRTNTVPHS